MSHPRRILPALAGLFLGLSAALAGEALPLFDGKSLAGWRASKNSPEGAYKVVDGVLQIRGGQGHLFFVGADGKASF
jgi:hypothetical protein